MRLPISYCWQFCIKTKHRTWNLFAFYYHEAVHSEGDNRQLCMFQPMKSNQILKNDNNNKN